MVTFVGADDLIFITPCENDPERMACEPPVYLYVCLDPAWDKHRALDLIHHFPTAFLLATLKGDQATHAMLLLDAVNFTEIEYTTTLQ